MKTKITLTLDEYDAAVLDKAIRIACKLRGDGDEPQSSHRRYLLRWIIGAVCSAIIRNGGMPRQLAVELRHESSVETRQRLTKEIPKSEGTGAAPRAASGETMIAVAQSILGKYYKPQLPDVQCVLSDLLRFSTANWDRLEPLWNAQLGYAEREALHPHDLWAAKTQKNRRNKRR